MNSIQHAKPSLSLERSISTINNKERQPTYKISRSLFRVGTFYDGQYFIHLDFEKLKGFTVQVNRQRNELLEVELAAPFSKCKRVSLRQLKMLSMRIFYEYQIRVIKLEGQPNRVEFIPKLLGGGQTSSTPSDEKKDDEESLFSLVFEKFRKFAHVEGTSITSASQLALALASAIEKKKPEAKNLEQWAMEMIDVYSKLDVKLTRNLSIELLELLQSKSQRVSQTIIKVLFKKFQKAPSLDAEILGFLGDAIRFSDPAHLDADIIVAILNSLCSKLDKFHTQTTTLPKLYQILDSLSHTLEAMGDANIEKLSYEKTYDPLFKTLEGFSGHEDWRIAAKADYAKEALLRIGHDKTKLIIQSSRLLSVGLGIGKVGRGLFEMNPDTLMEAYSNFKTASTGPGKKQVWFDELRFMLLLQSSDFDRLLTDKMNALPKGEQQFLFLRGLINALMEIVDDSKLTEEKQIFALQILSKLYKDDTKWSCQKEKVTNPIKIDLLKQFQQWALSAHKEKIRKQAKEALTQIQAAAITDAQKKLLVDAGIPDDLNSLVPVPSPSPPSPIVSPSKLPELMNKIRTEYLSDLTEIKVLLETYIAPCGSNNSSYLNAFSLEEEVRKYLQGPEKILLILGDSGSGKSTFGKYITYQLWKEIKNDSLIPIFILAGALKDPERNAIKETFESYGFTTEEIKRLQEEHSFLFIFDGFDEMSTRPNLYLENRLDKWKAKVIITCRTQSITEDEKQAVIIPKTKTGSPDWKVFREMWITPFSEREIDAYLKKYIEAKPEAPWRDIEKYKEQFNKIPSLKSLITNPFLLFLTAEVLPSIVEKHEQAGDSVKLEILRLDLYDAYMDNWFWRAEDRLQQSHKLSTFLNIDIKKYFTKFCKNLAVKMDNKKVSYVEYAPPDDETPDEWEEFFGNKPSESNKPSVALVRSGAPLKKVGGGDPAEGKASPMGKLRRKAVKEKYAFIHLSIQEYFVYRDSADPMKMFERQLSGLQLKQEEKRGDGK